ncbi:MAG: DUF2203 domain-containing protein [Terriglobia bacterium]
MGDEEKIFNRHQAEQLLATIAPLLAAAHKHKREVEALDQEFSQLHQHILLQGGIVPPYGQLADKRLAREALVEKIRDAIGGIEQHGCLVKDLDLGLVDFPTLRDNETVYLCWKLGEERIGYWHCIHEGFAGRKPLDSDEPRRQPKKDKPH